MPELPDVEVFRRYLERHAGGADIVEAEVRDSRCLADIAAGRFEGLLAGTQFGQTRRHGKHLFVRVKQNQWLTLHFGMTGYLLRATGDVEPDYTRIAFHLGGGDALHYILKRMLGRAGITDSPDAFIDRHDLGQDAFCELLQSDEMLFQAGIHPTARCGDLHVDARSRLDAARRTVLETAIEREADPERLPGEWLLRHRNEGERCPRCGGSIRREVISGRGSYLCDAHQERLAAY